MAYLSLLLIGLSYGATACMFSCMPFLSPLLLTQNGREGGALYVVSIFSLGRIVSYSLIAVAASFGAMAVKSLLDDPALSQSLLGISTVFVGGVLLHRSFWQRRCCSVSGGRQGTTGSVGYFAMGFAITLNPCAPVMSLIAVAAGSANAADALAMGLAFGLGAVSASWALYGLFFSQVAREAVAQLARYKTAIERIAALLLMAVGIATINGLSHL
ncbi:MULTISPECIES: sulfite exporter TauE/SafE family protein [Sulfurimonas]|uniref:Sulfite exporter TauE/SafE family protein n=1 Tax=Sulfurimonas diazotrophicus TaxID=3131939 RepID=A0ABZ3H772_9BACT